MAGKKKKIKKNYYKEIVIGVVAFITILVIIFAFIRISNENTMLKIDAFLTNEYDTNDIVEPINYETAGDEELIKYAISALATESDKANINFIDGELEVRYIEFTKDEIDEVIMSVFGQKVKHQDIYNELVNEEEPVYIYEDGIYIPNEDVELENSNNSLASLFYLDNKPLFGDFKIYDELYEYDKVGDEYVVTFIKLYEVLTVLGIRSNLSENPEYTENVDGLLNNFGNNDEADEFFEEYPDHKEMTTQERGEAIFKFYQEHFDEDLENIYKHQYTLKKVNGEFVIVSYDLVK